MLETEEHFTTRLKAGGLMDVVESYPWDGTERTFGRRDKRSGPLVGRVCRTPNGPAIQYAQLAYGT